MADSGGSQLHPRDEQAAIAQVAIELDFQDVVHAHVPDPLADRYRPVRGCAGAAGRPPRQDNIISALRVQRLKIYTATQWRRTARRWLSSNFHGCAEQGEFVRDALSSQGQDQVGTCSQRAHMAAQSAQCIGMTFRNSLHPMPRSVRRESTQQSQKQCRGRHIFLFIKRLLECSKLQSRKIFQCHETLDYFSLSPTGTESSLNQFRSSKVENCVARPRVRCAEKVRQTQSDAGSRGSPEPVALERIPHRWRVTLTAVRSCPHVRRLP